MTKRSLSKIRGGKYINLPVCNLFLPWYLQHDQGSSRLWKAIRHNNHHPGNHNRRVLLKTKTTVIDIQFLCVAYINHLFIRGVIPTNNFVSKTWTWIGIKNSSQIPTSNLYQLVKGTTSYFHSDDFHLRCLLSSINSLCLIAYADSRHATAECAQHDPHKCWSCTLGRTLPLSL